MYGWRCKLGLVVPIDNAVIEPELSEASPEGVSVHAARLDTMELPEMPADAEGEAANLETMGADVIGYACNASSFYGGREGDAEIRSRLSDVAGLPVTTASTAMVEALDVFDVTTLAVVTPYGPEDNERLESYLVEAGFEVNSVSGLGLASDEPGDLAAVNRQTAHDTYGRVVDMNTPDADAVLITATNLASLRTVEQMERDVGKPVVSTNQAILWHALRLSGVSPALDGYGRLLAVG